MCEQNRAWFYCRIAHPSNGSMQMQIEELRRYASEHGYSIAGITEEYGNGLSINRSRLAEIVAAAEDGKVDIVLVKNASRITRFGNQLLKFVSHLRNVNVALECTSGESPIILKLLPYAL